MQAKPHEALRVAAGSSLRAKLESYVLLRGANTILTYSKVRPARSPAASVVQGVIDFLWQVHRGSLGIGSASNRVSQQGYRTSSVVAQ